MELAESAEVAESAEPKLRVEPFWADSALSSTHPTPPDPVTRPTLRKEAAMKLDLSEILNRVGMHYTYEVDEPPIVDEDLECVSPITGKIVFANTGSVLLIDGNAQTTVVLPCGRCLAYYREPVCLPISEQFELEAKPAGRGGRQTHVVIEEDESPLAGKLFDGPLFDLTEMLRQGIMLALPSQPLHDEACKGLCPQCGNDLNSGPCDCRPDMSHHALAQLGALLKEKNGN